MVELGTAENRCPPASAVNGLDSAQTSKHEESVISGAERSEGVSTSDGADVAAPAGCFTNDRDNSINVSGSHHFTGRAMNRPGPVRPLVRGLCGGTHCAQPAKTHRQGKDLSTGELRPAHWEHPRALIGHSCLTRPSCTM